MTGSTGTPRLITGRGAVAALRELLPGRRVMVVASRSSIRRVRLDRLLPDGATVFSDFQPNPTTAQARSAAVARHGCGADLVVGLGGGSALDVAKAARALPAEPEQADRVLRGEARPSAGCDLVLVPTTAGTGSEVTRFATLYRDGRKVSLDADGVQADVAILDPALTESCPPDLTWSCAFDALSHAVESMWSERATGRSRSLAGAALGLLLPVLRSAAGTPTAAEREKLSEAATLAGLAIDRTRTTAAHALAYPLTVHLGVPHGVACALNLTWLAPMVERELAGTSHTGLAALRKAFEVDRGGLGEEVSGMLGLRRLRAPTADAAVVELVVDQGLSSERVDGTPIRLDRTRVLDSIGLLLRAGPRDATGHDRQAR